MVTEAPAQAGAGRPVSSFRPYLNLRLRILIVALLPLLVAVGLFAAYFAHRGVSEAERDLLETGHDSSRHLAEAIAYDLFTDNLPNVKRLLDFERSTRNILAIAVSDGRDWLIVSGRASVLPSPTPAQHPSQWRRGTMLYFMNAVKLSASSEMDPYLPSTALEQPKAYLVLVLDRSKVELTRSEIGLAAAGMAGLSILLALVLAWRLAGGVSSPLHALTRAVGTLADGDLAQRVPEGSPGEIGRLERGVNSMASALEENQRTLERRITEATAELLGQKQAAEAAVLAKSRFLAAASHDLRQPLHALTLLVTALKERVWEKESKRLAEHIEASASAMESLLNALLDLSRLDAGVVEARPVCFPVERVLKSLERQFTPLAQEKGLQLKVRSSELWVFSDPALLERILANLLSNALRYTDQGRVLIGIRRIHKEWLRLEVWDTGRGIPQEFLGRIFEEYFQMENPERHRDKGLGLGLAIVSRTAQLLGSRVSVRSTLGKGSCFSLQVSRCAPATQQMAQAVPVSPGFALPLENALVAFIDDDEAILGAMVEVFDHWGVALAVGENAEQVKQELLELGRRPDIILCDYRLRDGRNGIEAVSLLRDAFGQDIAAALLTGDTAPDTIQAINASHLPVLHKPLKPAKLRAFLSHLLSGEAGRPAKATTTQ